MLNQRTDVLHISPSRISASNFVICLLCAFAVLFTLQTSTAYAANVDELKSTIKKQKKQAKRTENQLKALEKKEKAINKELADTADRIQLLSRTLAAEEEKLQSLEEQRDKALKKHATLTGKRKETQEDLANLMQSLWPLHIQNKANRGINAPDWHDADRKYEWTKQLYATIAEKQNLLAQQESAISSTLEEHTKLVEEARNHLRSVNKSKDSLLKDKLAYNKKLQRVKQKKESAEEELKGVLSLIGKLHYKLEQNAKGEGAFALFKGTLPWPAEGMLAHGYSPKSDPPSRGLGMALFEGAPIKAVASGKVVHNDVLRGFGRVVIILHGSAYYSLYAFLTDSNLTVGQNVKGGQILGSAGYYPRVEGPGLYFELRFHQKAINPETWLTALN